MGNLVSDFAQETACASPAVKVVLVPIHLEYASAESPRLQLERPMSLFDKNP